MNRYKIFISRGIITAAVIGIGIFLAIPNRGHIQTLLTTHFPHVMMIDVVEAENIPTNTTYWKSLSVKQKLKVFKNYKHFHSLSKEEKIKIMRNYIDWVRMEPEEKEEAIQIYKEKQISKCKPFKK